LRFYAFPFREFARGKMRTIRQKMTKTSARPAFPPIDPREHARWLEGIASLQEAAELVGVSVDTLKREAAKGRYRLIQVSERRLGIRRRDALGL
jgi:hypothetical protein